MANENQNRQNDGGLNTLAEAQNVPPAEGDGNRFQSESYGIYSVTALEGAVVKETDDKGAPVMRTRMLWVHQHAKRYWDFISYKSDCWVWVTDAENGGNPVVVDQLEAHIVHNSAFGENRKIEKNVSSVHARARHYGIAVANPSVCAWGCAEQSDFGRWCTEQKCL